MFYAIREPFSPADGGKWDDYCEWRGIEFESFESIDGLLRPNLFELETDEDWGLLAKESYSDSTVLTPFISDLESAQRKRAEIGRGDVVGLEFDGHDTTNPDFLGFDLIEGDGSISLLTNFGNDFNFINRALTSNALAPDLETVAEIRLALLNSLPKDPHVKDCRIVSVYRPEIPRDE